MGGVLKTGLELNSASFPLPQAAWGENALNGNGGLQFSRRWKAAQCVARRCASSCHAGSNACAVVKAKRFVLVFVTSDDKAKRGAAAFYRKF